MRLIAFTVLLFLLGCGSSGNKVDRANDDNPTFKPDKAVARDTIEESADGLRHFKNESPNSPDWLVKYCKALAIDSPYSPYIGPYSLTLSDAQVLTDSNMVAFVTNSNGTCLYKKLLTFCNQLKTGEIELYRVCDMDYASSRYFYREYNQTDKNTFEIIEVVITPANPNVLDSKGNFKNEKNLDNVVTVEDTTYITATILPSGLIMVKERK